MRFVLAISVLFLAAGVVPFAQDSESAKPDTPKVEPKYDETCSGTIVELTDAKIVVWRSILGKPAETRTFLIQSDTRIEGKLKVKTKVTIGFTTTPDGDVAKLIIARPGKSSTPKK